MQCTKTSGLFEKIITLSLRDPPDISQQCQCYDIKTGHVIYLSVLQKHFDIILEHMPSALWINVHQAPT